MPCRTQDDDFNGDNGPREEYWLKKENDELAALLCEQCKALHSVNHPELITPRVRTWNKEHQKEDSERIKNELALLDKKREKLIEELKLIET